MSEGYPDSHSRTPRLTQQYAEHRMNGSSDEGRRVEERGSGKPVLKNRVVFCAMVSKCGFCEQKPHLPQDELRVLR
jgi:hypothetical protein